MSNKVLTVVHQEHSTPGKIGLLLEEWGYRLERRCPMLGDSLPTDLSDYAAAIVFGGPQSANDDHLEGIRSELDWLEQTALVQDCPLLGICLGAQSMARVLGARVGAHQDGLVEIGYFEVCPTDEDGDFLPEPTVFYQWHSETFEIPTGAVHLARNDAFEGQAFAYAQHAYGIEFHPEMTFDMVERWCNSERGKPKLEWRGAMPYELHRSGYARHAQASDRWLENFLERKLHLRPRGQASE